MDLIPKDIRKNQFAPFYLNRTDQPLYCLLRAGFYSWISRLESGSKFPSERVLAEELKVNRRTIRKALEVFLQTGKLVRRGKETFVGTVHAADNDGASSSAPCNTSFSMQDTMTLLIPEDLPEQVNFWTHLIDKFNRLIPTVHLVPVFTQNLSLFTSQYRELFYNGNFDLAVLPTPLGNSEASLKHLLPVKDSWKKLFHSDHFLSGMLNETYPSHNEYAYTYSYTFQRLEWLKKYHLFDGVPAGAIPFDEMLRKANQYLPENLPLFPTYYDICRDLGVPVKFTPELIREHCEIVFNRIDSIKERKIIFNSHEISWGHLNGHPGKQAFCSPSFSNSSLITKKQDDQSQVSSIYQAPRQDSYYWGGCGMVGINKNSENIQSALLFIEYLLSKPVQDLIWKSIHAAPVRTESLATVDFVLENELVRYLGRCRQNPRQYPTPVGCAMMPYFEQYLKGEISRDNVVQNDLRFYE